MSDRMDSPRISRIRIHTRHYQETCEFYARLLDLAPVGDSSRACFALADGLELEVVADPEHDRRLDISFTGGRPDGHAPAVLDDPLGNQVTMVDPASDGALDPS
jgi:catechol 2,3-dioxygenase-like lactoylglutathione lyase family enzyme